MKFPQILTVAALGVLMPLTSGALAQDDKQPAATQPAKSPPVVKVIDAGQGDKTELRFSPAAGQEEIMTMTMEMSMAMEMPGMGSQEQAMPIMKMVIATTVESVDDNGDIHYAFQYKSADVLETPGVNPMMIEQMKQGMKEMEGVSGSGVVSNRGITRSTTTDFDEEANPELAQMMDMGMSFEQYFFVLPEEAMGAGGVWEVHSDVDQMGIKLSQIARYTILSMEGGALKVKTELTQTAKAQKFAPAGSPVEMDLEAMDAKTVGESSMSMKRLMPISGQSDTETHMKMSMGEAMQMTMDMTIKVKISSE